MKRKAKSKNSFMAYVLILALLLIGMKGFLWVFSDTRLILKSKDWERCDATVLSSSITKSIGGSKYSSSIMYSLRIQYSFHDHGRPYLGDRYQIPPRRHSSKSYVTDILKNYPPGKRIQVYFNPDDPGESVIVKPEFNSFFTFFLGALSIALILSGFGLAYWMVTCRND